MGITLVPAANLPRPRVHYAFYWHLLLMPPIKLSTVGKRAFPVADPVSEEMTYSQSLSISACRRDVRPCGHVNSTGMLASEKLAFS